jgi:CrcB protein
MLSSTIVVFFGGAIGAVTRFLISEWFPIAKFGIPLTIIIINFFGCFLMGVCDGLFQNFTQNYKVRHFLTIGFLVSFTTFSSFSLEFFTLLRSNHFIEGVLYLIFSLVISLLGFLLGYSLIKVLS